MERFNISLIWGLYSYCSYCGPVNLIEIVLGHHLLWLSSRLGFRLAQQPRLFSARGSLWCMSSPWEQRKSSSWLRLASDKSRTWRTSSHAIFLLSCRNCQEIIDRDARPLSLHMFLRTLAMSPGWLAPRFGVAHISFTGANGLHNRRTFILTHSAFCENHVLTRWKVA